jgi:GMP synthase-like glutamine amidotransferase
MGVVDEAAHPWLAPEKAFIRAAVGSGKTVVGVCLGAQLIAEVLGARVYRGPHQEIGWFPIRILPDAAGTPLAGVPDGMPVFHWHGDTFELPAGARHLAASDVTPHQAFLVGDRVLGLQFHLETTVEGASALIDNCDQPLGREPFVQSAADMLAQPERFDRIRQMVFPVLDALLGAGS